LSSIWLKMLQPKMVHMRMAWFEQLGWSSGY
jgi:hypothetical protein